MTASLSSVGIRLLWALALGLWLGLTCTAEQNDGRPARPRREAEIVLRVIEAASTQKAPNDAAELVPPELRALLRFRAYRLLDAALLRGQEGETHRIALAGTFRGKVRFEVEERQGPRRLRLDVEIEGPPGDKGNRPTLLDTETSAASGETVVLGASRMQSGTQALIILLTARLLP